jgi:hypothetical protein
VHSAVAGRADLALRALLSGHALHAILPVVAMLAGLAVFAW